MRNPTSPLSYYEEGRVSRKTAKAIAFSRRGAENTAKILAFSNRYFVFSVALREYM